MARRTRSLRVSSWDSLFFLFLFAIQLLLSGLLGNRYFRALDLPYTGLLELFHLSEVGLLLAIFLLAWATIRGCSWGERIPSLKRLFAASLVGLLGLLNLIYVGQLMAVQIWAGPLDLDILRGFIPQVRSLVAIAGPLPYIILGLVGLLSLAAFWIADRFAARLWQQLRRAAPSQSRPSLLCLMLGVLLLVVCIAPFQDPRLAFRTEVRADPFLSLIVPPLEVNPNKGNEYTADLIARQSYPTKLPGHHPNIVLITIDDLRADHLPLYGYQRDTTPFLDQLMATGAWNHIDRAYATSDASAYGLLSILGSRFPERIYQGNFALPEVLQRAGYHTRAILSGDHTYFQRLRHRYGQHFDSLVDGASGPFALNDDRNVVAGVENLPPSGGSPTFLWLHLMSVHALGVRLPGSARWGEETDDWRARFWGKEAGIQRVVDAYDNGIAQADAHLRSIFTALRTKGYLRDYIAVITSDHGESLGEHENFGHGLSLFEPEVRIPLLVGSSAKIPPSLASFASQIDVASSLLAAASLPKPSSWKGRSFFTAGNPAKPLETYLIASPPRKSRAVLIEHNGDLYKYLSNAAHSTEHLFNITADPEESHDLISSAPVSLRDHLKQLLTAHL